MTKRFCDLCGTELTEGNTPNHGEDKRSLTNVWKEKLIVTVSIGKFKNGSGEDAGWQRGDFCSGCVLDAVADLDKRPGQSAACIAQEAAKHIKYELQQARIESQTLLKTIIDAHVDSERLIDSLNKSSDAVAWVSSKNSIT